jgi:hypothetical protein
VSALQGFLASMADGESIEFQKRETGFRIVFRKETGTKLYSKFKDATNFEIDNYALDKDNYMFGILHYLKGDVLTHIEYEKKRGSSS